MSIEDLVLQVNDDAFSGLFVLEVGVENGKEELVDGGEVGDLEEKVRGVSEVEGQVSRLTVEEKHFEFLGDNDFGGNVDGQDDGDKGNPKEDESLVGEGVYV